jgi:hypothetical protein
VVGVVKAPPAAAQDQVPSYIDVDPQWAAEMAALGRQVAPYNVREALQRARSRFRLFGEGDRAWTSLRMVGDNQIRETNTGPGDDLGLFNAFGPIIQSGTTIGTRFQSFGIPLMWGTPRSEWVKYLQENVESLRNVKGDPAGYSVMWNGDIFARNKDLNAADGLVGNLLSGVTSTTDGTCLDHSAFLGGGSIGAGFQLLPASNCSPTWSFGGTTWLGDRPISADAWVDLFNQRGVSFEFNRWQVPGDMKDQERFLGNNVSTYGHFNDYNSSVLAKFGNVVPGGVGDPTREGYPLGLDVVFNSFSFTIPTVANVKFWSGLIINNSQAVYGVPHDYDSLYVGVGMWPGRGQDGDNYPIIEKGAWVSAESSNPNSPECQDADPIPLLGNTCGGFTRSTHGFDEGAHGAVVLKSPIGDLRNKLFSDPASPFFMPGHPLAGDTITYNHMISWNFGPWGDVWNQGSDRQRFGILSSTSENILDGTACQDFFGNGTRYSVFWSNDWPNNQCAKGYYVPGDWTYVSGRPLGADPAGPDTLWLAGCGPTGCPEVWRDTTWQGWSINRFGNLSQFSIGPFRLEAGDTTELLMAWYSGKDSVSFEAITDGILDFYLGFFQGPEAPPPVTIRDIDIGAGVTPGQGAQVTLVWDAAAEQFTDPFLAKFADDMESAPTGTDLANIRDANPGIVDRIRARADNNLKRLLLYKSCDGGNTFDANGDCEGDPAFDESGNTVPPGWQAFAILAPDASGDVPNTFTDGLITPGVTYLYVLLGETLGFEEVVINDPNAQIDGSGNFTCGPNPCQLDTLKIAPSIIAPLSRATSDPNVVSVYVPASSAAGGRVASVEFTDRDSQGKSSVPFDLVLTSKDIRENTFKAVFGNFLQITEWRDATTEELDSVRVTVEDLARTVVGDTGTTTLDFPLASETFMRRDGVPVTLNGATLVNEQTVGNVLERTYEIGPGDLDPDNRFAIGFAVVEAVGADMLPLLATGQLDGAGATPGGFLANPAFPGFLVTADNTRAATFNQQFYLDANGDTLSAQLDPTLGLDQANTNNTGIQGLTFGTYSVTFADSVFGPLAPFTLTFTDPQATDAVFDASLAARRAGTTGATDAETAALVAAELGVAPDEVTLVPANIPFTVTNVTYGRTATLAMVDRGEMRKVLGLGRDTLSVTVDSLHWIPGDLVYVIEELDVFRTRDVDGDEAIVVNESGTPIRETASKVTFAPLSLVCGGANRTCNPVRGSGFGGWVGTSPNDDLRLEYYAPFTTQSEFIFVPSRSIQGREILAAGLSIEEMMDSIQVVPNPYLFFSDYEASNADRRLMFTNLPPDGEIRIYTVAGNFVQEVDWGPDDLAGNGDLFWDMQTREGNELGPGLYIFVVKATDPATGRELKKMGKFVVIR